MAKTRVTSQDVGDGLLTDSDVATANKDGGAATPSMRTLGTGAAQAAAGDHPHTHAATTGQTATDHHAAPVAGPDANIVVDAAGAAGTAGAFARSAHGHRVDTTAGPGANDTIDAAGAAGTAGAFARSAHGHRVDTTAGPGAAIAVGAAGAAGATGALARAAHGHRVDPDAGSGADLTIDAAGTTGSATTLARGGHGHRANTYASVPPAADATAGSAGTSGTAPARGDHRHLGHTQSHNHSAAGDGSTLVPGLVDKSDGVLAGIWLRSKAAADAAYRLTVMGGGAINWGDGTAATDTQLSRSAVGEMFLSKHVKTDNTGFLRTGGTSFPASPVTGDLYYRTDLMGWYQWNGTRWLSETLFSEKIGYVDALAATGDSLDRLPGDAAQPAGLQIEEWHYAFFINGGTALSASHKWDVQLKSFVGNVGTVRSTVTISSGGLSAWRNLATTGVAAVLDGIDMYQVTATKTGTPGSLSGVGRMVYRRIAT